jgi:8-oxo-dGTP pyrophosphatase MutT (NUDIX family)
MTMGVRVLAVDEAGRVCLVRHTYTPGWHLPGGGVERGETGLAAAVKEAREEAGLVISPQDMSLLSIHTNFDNFPGDHILVYRAAKWDQTTTASAHEIAEFGFFAINDPPEGTTGGTKRRIAEWQGSSIGETW